MTAKLLEEDDVEWLSDKQARETDLYKTIQHLIPTMFHQDIVEVVSVVQAFYNVRAVEGDK